MGTQFTADQLMGRELSDAGNRRLFRSLRRDMEAAGRSPATIGAYNQGCRSLESWLIANGHDPDFAAVGRDEAAAWLTWLQAPAPRGGGYAKDSVVSYFRSVRRFFNFLVAEEVIAVSPLARIPQPSESGKPIEFPSVDEIRAVIAACRPAKGRPSFDDLRDEMVVRLFAEAGGPRCNEVAALPLNGIDLETDTMRICGKGQKWRTIALSPKTAKAVEKYLRARQSHEHASVDRLVIGKVGGMRPNGLYQMIGRRCRRAGLPVWHPHQFRHASAARAKRAGMQRDDMKRLYGWTSDTMLERYGAAEADGRALEAARRLNLGNDL